MEVLDTTPDWMGATRRPVSPRDSESRVAASERRPGEPRPKRVAEAGKCRNIVLTCTLNEQATLGSPSDQHPGNAAIEPF